MKPILKMIVPLMLAIMLCFSSMSVIPSFAEDEAYGSATGSSGTGSGIISITGGSHGITIKPGSAPDMTNVGDAYTTVGNTVISKGKVVAQTITAVCTIICFVALFISITKLSTSGSHPMQRRAAIIGILWSGIALTLFGGGWIIVSFFWNFLSP